MTKSNDGLARCFVFVFPLKAKHQKSKRIACFLQTHKTTRGGITRYHQTVTLLVISPPNQKDTKRLGSNCCFIKLPEVGKRNVRTNQIVKQVKRG